MNEKNDTLLKELIISILLFTFTVQVLLVVLSNNLLNTSIGLWVGTMMAAVMAVHMKRSIEDALDMGAAGAVAHMRKSYAVRMFIVIIVFGVTFYFHIGNVFTAFIGIMGLKVAAYLQPCMHKILLRIQKSK